MQGSKNFTLTVFALLLIFVAGFLFLGFPLPITQIDYEQPEDMLVPASQTEEAKILNSAYRLNEALVVNDFDTISEYISSEYGLSFAVNGYFSDQSLNFTLAEFLEASASDKVYTWGYTDGKGDPIEYTLEAFVQEYLLQKDYLNADDISFNKLVHTSNSLFNANEFFGGGIDYVEYNLEAEDENLKDFDWSSLVFVFKEDKLVGIALRTWTI